MKMAADRRSSVIEPLDSERHDRAGFSSGVDAVDNFFRSTAGKLSRADNLRVFVLCEGERVIGFHALNAHSVAYADLPAKYARTRPSHGDIPAGFIAMIGVDRRFQGRGFGGDLLVDALERMARAAHDIGLAVVLLDILDCGDARAVERRRALYESFGFRSLPSRPNRLFLPIATVRSLLDGTPR